MGDTQEQCPNEPRRPSTDELVRAYLAAKRSVIDGGYAHEIAWQSATGPLTPQRFVREAAWVIMCTGMSETVVSRLFPQFLEQLGGLNPAWLTRHAETARRHALRIFGHEKKIESILSIATTARDLGSDGLRRRMREPEGFLLSLPYIGPVTWRHLAKNLGIPVAKADRHLTRLAAATRRSSVDALCTEISAWLGDPIPVVDIVLWRWSILHARTCGRTCSQLPLPDQVHRGPLRPQGDTASLVHFSTYSAQPPAESRLAPRTAAQNKMSP